MNTCFPVHLLIISASSYMQYLNANLPTYSPAYFPHFLLIQDVPNCQMNTCPPVYLLCISASSSSLSDYLCTYFLFPTQPNADLSDEYRSQFIYCTFLHPHQSADLPTTSSCVAHNFPYSGKLFFGVLISISVLIQSFQNLSCHHGGMCEDGQTENGLMDWTCSYSP